MKKPLNFIRAGKGQSLTFRLEPEVSWLLENGTKITQAIKSCAVCYTNILYQCGPTPLVTVAVFVP